MSTGEHAPQQPIEVGILGATGMVGQQFIRVLDRHPWFKPTWLAASGRSEGKAYEDAVTWRLETPPPDDVRRMQVQACTPGQGPRLVFSALDAAVAKDLEPAYAAAGASGHQQYPDGADGSGRAAGHSRGQRRSSRPDHAPAPRARLDRGDRDEPQLLDGGDCAGPRAAAPVRPAVADGDHPPGRLRRRVSWRALPRHPRQRRAGHFRRRRKDRERDPEDPRHLRGRRGRRCTRWSSARPRPACR